MILIERYERLVKELGLKQNDQERGITGRLIQDYADILQARKPAGKELRDMFYTLNVIFRVIGAMQFSRALDKEMEPVTEKPDEKMKNLLN